MSQITWKNVNSDIPDISGNYGAFSDALTKAFSGLGTGLTDFQTARQDVVSNVLKSRLLRQDNTAEYQNALKSGEMLGGVDPSLISGTALDMLSNQVDVLKKRDAADEAMLASKADRKLTGARTDSEVDDLLTAAINRRKISSDISANEAGIEKTGAEIQKLKADTNSVRYDDAFKQASTKQVEANTGMAQGRYDTEIEDRNESKANANAYLQLYANKEKDEGYQQSKANIMNSALSPTEKTAALKGLDVASGYDPNSLSPVVPASQDWDSVLSNPVTLRVKSNGKTINVSSNNLGSASEFSAGKHEVGTVTAMEMLQTQFDGSIDRFTGGNDNYHKGSATSAHPKGRAFDVTLKDGQDYATVTNQMREFMASSGLRESDFKIIDEKNYPSSKATAPHIHVELTEKGAEKLKQFKEASSSNVANNANAAIAKKVIAEAPVINEQAKVVTKTYRAAIGLPDAVTLPEGASKHPITYGNTIAKNLGFTSENSGTRIAEVMQQLEKEVPAASMEDIAAVTQQAIKGDTRFSRWFKVEVDNFDDRNIMVDEAKIKLDQITYGKNLDQQLTLKSGEEVFQRAAESAKQLDELKTQLAAVQAQKAQGIPVGNAEASLKTALEKAITQAEAQQTKAKELAMKWGSAIKSPIPEKTARTTEEAKSVIENMFATPDKLFARYAQ